jgi:enoyl-CoA hydratase
MWTCTNKDGVVTAVYHNPPMNYFTAAAIGELDALVESWRDPAVRAVIFTGAIKGKFITHYSVEELAYLAEDHDRLGTKDSNCSKDYHTFLHKIRDLGKPVICAINGDAMGGGFEFTLFSDIRIMSRGDHRIGLPEVRLGILPGGCGTQQLPRQIGLAKATEFILRGRVVNPETALSLGLVHELADDALVRAQEIAADMITLSAEALNEAKRSIYEGYDMPLRQGLDNESVRFINTMRTAEGLRIMQDYIAVPLAERRDWIDKAR